MDDVARRLRDGWAGHVEEICVELLGSSGQREGPHLQYADLQGGKGQSLKVTLAGEHAGKWTDFATDDSGDLIDIASRTRGLDFIGASEYLADLLGIELDRPTLPQYEPCSLRGASLTPATDSPASEYLHQRGLSDEALKAYRVGYDSDNDQLVFVSLKDRVLSRWKRVAVKRDGRGKKIIKTSKGSMPCCFGWHAVDPKSRTLVITEGEIDAISVHQATGYSAVSVPNGVSNLDWIEADADKLSFYELIYILLDGDDAGRSARPKIAERMLGKRILFAEIDGFKDANEALQSGDVKAISDALIKAETLRPTWMVKPSDRLSHVMALAENGVLGGSGIMLPWNIPIKLKAGETTLLHGYDGSGKSLLASQIALDGLKQNCSTFFISLEWTTDQLLNRLVRQVIGKPTSEAPREFVQEALCFMDKGIVVKPPALEDSEDSMEERIEDILRMMAAAQHEARANGKPFDLMVFDNLCSSALRSDDYEGQSQVVGLFRKFAQKHGTHVLIVAHDRKRDNNRQYQPPARDEIAGSKELSNKVTNVIGICRDPRPAMGEQLQHRVDRGYVPSIDEEYLLDFVGKPGCKVLIDKSNSCQWTGGFALHYQPESELFTREKKGKVRFIEYEAEPHSIIDESEVMPF